MKIIKPMDGIKGESSNDAPPDDYQQWEPDGRSNELPASDLVSVGGNFAFYAPLSFSNTDIHVYDLSSGELAQTISDPAVAYVSEISASPDGNYIAYSYSDGSGNSGVKVYDLGSSQIVFTRLDLRISGFLSWSPDSSTLAYYDQSLAFGGKFLYCVKVQASAWNSPAVSGNLLNESGLSVSGIVSLSPKAPAISDSGVVFAFFRAKENASSGGSSAVVLSRLSSAMAATHTELLPGSVYASALIANEARSEIIVVHSTGGSFFAYADLATIGAPASISGVAYKGAAVSVDGSELTLQSSSVQPYNRRIALADYSAMTAMPVTDDYKGASYATDYAFFLRSSGAYDLVDLATNTLITQSNPAVTKGDIYTYQNRNYEALTDNSDRPDLGAIANPPTWLDMGVVNPLRMFDGKLDSRTTAPDVLTITVSPGVIANGLALFNVSAQSVQVTMGDPVDGMVYDSGDIAMLDNSAVSNWWEFFYSPYVAKADLALTDLPPYPDAEITITISNPGDVAAIGEMVLGRIQSIGEIQYGTNVGIIDSSTKERDVFGNFEIIERKFSKRAEFDVSMTTGSVSGVQRILAGYRASPVVWIGEIDYEATIVYGFYRDFQINFSHYSLSDATITVEGL